MLLRSLDVRGYLGDDRRKRDLRLAINLHVDKYFHDWLKTLPDLRSR